MVNFYRRSEAICALRYRVPESSALVLIFHFEHSCSWQSEQGCSLAAHREDTWHSLHSLVRVICFGLGYSELPEKAHLHDTDVQSNLPILVEESRMLHRVILAWKLLRSLDMRLEHSCSRKSRKLCLRGAPTLQL